MGHWKRLLSFVLVYLVLAEAASPPCSNEDCYVLLERDLNGTQQRSVNIRDSLDQTGLHLTATLQQLDNITSIVNDTFMYAELLNTSEAQLFNTFTSVSDALVSSQQQVYNLTDLLTSTSANATVVAMTSRDAAVTINQTIDHIMMATETLDQLETAELPMLENVATLIAEQTDNGTGLYAELMTQLTLVTSQASQLFNMSLRSLNIINTTVVSLINSSALQNIVATGVLAQMEVRKRISDDLDSLTDDLRFIQQRIQFFSIYFSEETSTFPLVSIDQLNQELQETIQLTTNVSSLLENISTLTDLRRELYAMLLSYEASYELLPGQIQVLEQEALRLYNDTFLLNQNAMTAAQEADQLVAEAQYLQMVLQDFSGFVATASDVLQNIEAIQMSAVNTINTANNISVMIMETCRRANDSLLTLMASSDLAQAIQMTFDLWNTEVSNAVQTTQDLEFINSSRTLLETAWMTVENVTLDFSSQQGSIDEIEVDIEEAAEMILDATNSCNNASDSVVELQSQLDNLSALSYEDIEDIRNRIILVEMSIDDIENIVATLTSEITQQKATIDMLENEITDIMTERDTLTELYNSLPQSCDEEI